MWKLVFFDTFAREYYGERAFDTQEEAEAAADEKLRQLEVTQPTASSEGQTGIQDRVFIVRPDGSEYRCFPK